MRMKRRSWTALGLALLWALVFVPGAVAGAKDLSSVKGQVVQLHNGVKTQNGGEFDELTVRTRQGEEMRLRLGAPGECDGCFRVGDQVRARVMRGGAQDGAYAVREMKMRDTGRTYQFRNESGELTRVRTRARNSAGSEQGSGSCARSRIGGSGGQRQGSGRNGGGRSGGGRR